jgi:hypothetical protein
MKKEYIESGKCIWCCKEKPDVSFFNKPHTISKQIGANNIGFDICDSCNHFFGTNSNSTKYSMSIELAFKEIFNVTKHLLSYAAKDPNYKEEKMKSVYFGYHKSKKIFRIKKRFELKKNFIRDFTRQFKKGIYEAFLQEYHRFTKKGHDERFDKIRAYVRYDIGDLPLYFADNNGIYLIPDSFDKSFFYFSEKSLATIDEFGFYQTWLFGHILFIEVSPRAESKREIYFEKDGKVNCRFRFY